MGKVCNKCDRKPTVAFICPEHGFIDYLNSEELERERKEAKRKFDEVTGDKTMLEKLIAAQEENLKLIELVDTLGEQFRDFLEGVGKIFQDKKEKDVVG